MGRFLEIAAGMASQFWRGRTVRPAGKMPVVDSNVGWESLWGIYNATTTDSAWNALTTADLEKAARNHALVQACVHRIGHAILRAPLVQGIETPEGAFEPLAKPTDIMQVWQQPNQDYTPELMLYLYAVRYVMLGEAYIWKWREGSRITQLWPVPSGWVTPTYGQSDTSSLVKLYKVKSGQTGKSVEVDPRDMVAGWSGDPASTTGGVGALEAAAHSYELDTDQETYLAEMLDHLEIPGLSIQLPEGVQLSDSERSELRASLYDQLGKGARGKALLLPGGATAHLTTPLADMDWPGFRSMNESRICAAFGVPAILVGAQVGLDRSTFSNYEEARRSFYEDTIAPLWDALAAILTQGLLRLEGDYEHVLRFDVSDIGELQENRTERANVAARLFQASLATRSEARELAGLPPDDDGGLFAVPLGVSLETSVEVEPEPELVPQDVAKRHMVPWFGRPFGGDID